MHGSHMPARTRSRNTEAELRHRQMGHRRRVQQRPREQGLGARHGNHRCSTVLDHLVACHALDQHGEPPRRNINCALSSNPIRRHPWLPIPRRGSRPGSAADCSRAVAPALRFLACAGCAGRLLSNAGFGLRLGDCVEPHFHADSYGYLPGRSAHMAVARARERCWRFKWVLDVDIRAFLDTSSYCTPSDAK